MAQYLKHYYVQGQDRVTYVTNTNTPTTGKTQPNINGLDVKFWLIDAKGIDFCLSVCPDETVVDTTTGIHPLDGGIWVLTYEQWAQEYVTAFERIKAKRIAELYMNAINIRNLEINNWSTTTEQSLFHAKYSQALLARAAENDTAADTAAPLLLAEATERAITTKQLAEKVITNYTTFTAREAEIAGIRGRISDQINALTVDTTSIDTLLESHNSIYAINVHNPFLEQ